MSMWLAELPRQTRDLVVVFVAAVWTPVRPDVDAGDQSLPGQEIHGPDCYDISLQPNHPHSVPDNLAWIYPFAPGPWGYAPNFRC